MSAFTFTAPILTEEDDRAERAAMTDEEKERYRAEIYGTEPELVESEDMVSNGLQLMQSALQDIPPEEKVDYQTAVDQVPELVKNESPPLAFLRVTEFDAWAAARRMVLYWSTRREVFGTERFLLPMTLEAAMTEDVPFLEKGIIMVLQDDAHHRAVLFVDRMRCTKGVVPRDSAIRCLWYALQTLAKQEQYQQRGYVGLMNYRGCDLYKHFDRILTKKSVWTTSCMPVRPRAVHICTGSGASVTRDLILPVLKHMLGRDGRLRLQLHAGSNTEILAHFRDYGMSEPHVRAVFGGEGNRVEIKPWLERQRDIELVQVSGNVQDGDS